MAVAAAFSPWRWTRGRLVVGLALWLAAVTVPMAPVAAQQRQADDPVFTVTNVPVDVSAPNPLQAREKALVEGEKRAFEVLVRRLVAAEDVAKFPTPSDADLETMVKGFEFAEERTAPGRYIALLSVVFRADRIAGMIRGAAVPFVASSAPPVLTIPLVRTSTGVVALGEKTPWRDAWGTVAKAGGLVPMRVLRADAEDLKGLDPEQAFVGDTAVLGRIAERYGVHRVLVSIASGETDGPFAVSGTLYEIGLGEKTAMPAQNAVAADKLTEAAVRHRTKLEEDWKSVAALSHDIADAVVVTVPLKDLAEWVKVRRRISAVASVRRVQVQTLEEGRAVVVVNFVGTRAQLDRAMQQQGLSLVDGGGTGLSIVMR
ncbi:DUF2066 domain-containing protein [Reyranella sp. CPCC 100927]|uniref:DUF2066 domain-containing protein n=1 Tax=Reyranella sp. CPCC 100927 TaxID=2599616 RepID=UPI0011B42CBD|nr:DUF2066 domain-containing protein [Reyranella sp. CPCC 100927]TWT13039.1 DUF2066 domain-containing protein [Reyranella sp. CPCC 100927]